MREGESQEIEATLLAYMRIMNRSLCKCAVHLLYNTISCIYMIVYTMHVLIYMYIHYVYPQVCSDAAFVSQLPAQPAHHLHDLTDTGWWVRGEGMFID